MLTVSAASQPAVKVSELNGFREKQRIVAQDVQASPPQFHAGTIVSVWSDRTATVQWDYDLPFAVERRLVRSGHVELHNLTRHS
ncbi:hypothetical protein [Paraburkholderia tagetis]|uniref:Uncharacterized protein n=1 Tax=Paraburkholderia tagetis TaxID=2913261 RepID=A0A9X1UL32_9BURK|nr:hypothetical protein [Paraburkholderia tagetis]MCG5077261.1 hypothetical protein [Paraburkholderia tagetis]